METLQKINIVYYFQWNRIEQKLIFFHLGGSSYNRSYEDKNEEAIQGEQYSFDELRNKSCTLCRKVEGFNKEGRLIDLPFKFLCISCSELLKKNIIDVSVEEWMRKTAYSCTHNKSCLKFSSRSNLIDHLRRILNIRPYSCANCKK